MDPLLQNAIDNATISSFDPLTTPQESAETGEPEVHVYGYFMSIDICDFDYYSQEQQNIIMQHYVEKLMEADIYVSALNDADYGSIVLLGPETVDYNPSVEGSLENWQNFTREVSEVLGQPIDIVSYDEYFNEPQEECGPALLSQAPVVSPTLS